MLVKTSSIWRGMRNSIRYSRKFPKFIPVKCAKVKDLLRHYLIFYKNLTAEIFVLVAKANVKRLCLLLYKFLC